MDETVSNVEELSRRECLALLGQVPYGRFAVNRREGSPHVVPVNFVLVDDTIVFRTGAGTKLTELHRRLASFQADLVDTVNHCGWSVLVEGVAYELSADEVGDIALEPWAAGAMDHWVRLVPGLITGRRLVLPPAGPSDARGYL